MFLWIFLFGFICSFLTGPVPGAGVAAALSLLCGFYGKGIEEGYLILYPVMPLLTSFAAAIDVLTAALASMLVARHENMQKEIPIKDFI